MKKKKPEKQYPKVMIGIPTYEKKDYCLKDLLKALNKIKYPNFDIVFCDSSSSMEYYEKLKKLGLTVLKSQHYNLDKRINLRDCRRSLRVYFLNNKYDYFLSLESDNIPPSNVIELLLKHDKRVVGGWYTLRSGVPSVSLKGPFESGNRLIIPEIGRQSEIFKVFMMGLGCVLIKREVLEKINFTVEKHYSDGNEAYWYDDVFFYLNCQKINISCYVLKDLRISHHIDESTILN